ncbi:hypothetical protein [Nostocoides japonicum]|uniref:hypothetical protein n=1 Tax=Nostocoides japonicum TaxID=99481 RepID=UPI00065BF0DC|nr:hypothetical protein [Tetrasphaera japonica]
MPEPVVPDVVDDVELDDALVEDDVVDVDRFDDVAVDRWGDDAALVDELLCDPPAEVDEEWWPDPEEREVLDDGFGLGFDDEAGGFGLGFGVESRGGTAAPGGPPDPNENPMTDPAGG